MTNLKLQDVEKLSYWLRQPVQPAHPRRIRGIGVFSGIKEAKISAAEVKRINLSEYLSSGGPNVYEDGSFDIDPWKFLS